MPFASGGGPPRLTVESQIRVLRAGQHNRFTTTVRLQAPSAGVPAHPLCLPWARRLRLYLRPSAGVALVPTAPLERIPAPVGEIGWTLPDLHWSADITVALQVSVDRGLALPGTCVPLLWVRIAGVVGGRMPLALRAPALALAARAAPT